MYSKTGFIWCGTITLFPVGAEMIEPNSKSAKPHCLLNGVEVKHCSICNNWKPVTKFDVDTSKWDGRASSCKRCTAKRHSLRYFKNPKGKSYAKDPNNK